MEKNPILNRHPELKELVQVFKTEVQNAQRPANEIILVDQDVMRILKISKRKLDYMKSNLEIPFSQPKERSICYYRLSDILSYVEKGRVEAADAKLKF